jgi:hypothetical protein
MPKSSLLLKIFISFATILTFVNLFLVLNPTLFPNLPLFSSIARLASLTTSQKDLSDTSTPEIFSQNFDYDTTSQPFTQLRTFVKNTSGKLVLTTSDTIIRATVQNNFFVPDIKIRDTKDPTSKNLYISEIFDTTQNGYFRNTNLALSKNLTHTIRTVIDNSQFEGDLSTLSITQLDLESNKSTSQLTLPSVLPNLNLYTTNSSVTLTIPTTSKIKIISDTSLTLDQFSQISQKEYVYNLAENESPNILVNFTSNQSSNLQITLY